MKMIFFVFMILFNLNLQAHHFRDDVIKIAYASNWQPYSYKNLKTGKPDGVLVKLMEEIFHNKLGIKIIHELQPWSRAQNSVKNNVLDVLFSKSTEDRLAYTYSSKPFYFTEWSLFVSKKNANFEKILSLENPLLDDSFSYLSVLGDKTTQLFYEQNNLEYHEVKSVTEAIRMLNSGRIAIFMHSSLATTTTIYNLGLIEEIVIHKKHYKKVPFSILLRKSLPKSKQLIKSINDTLEKMKKDGSLKKLIDKIENEEIYKFLKEKNLN